MDFFREFLSISRDRLRGLLYTISRPFVHPWRYFGKLFDGSAPKGVVLFVEFLFLCLVFGLLTFLTVYFGLDKAVGGPPALRKFWMGLVAVLAWCAMRLFFFVLKQMRLVPEGPAGFPDIDEAFDEGVEAMESLNCLPADVPIFLMIGLSAADEANLVRTKSIATEVRVDSPRLPIHWFGNKDGVWVTIPGVSALSQLSPSQSDETLPTILAPEPAAAHGEDERDYDQTLGEAGVDFATLKGELDATDLKRHRNRPASTEQLEGIKGLTVRERELCAQRMEYFCRLLKELRYPVCPLNACVLAAPLLLNTSSESNSRIGDAIKIDMSVLQSKLGVKCLSMAMFTGLERSSDLIEYINRLPADHTRRRCGISFPQLTEMQPSDPEQMHAWLVTYFEQQIFRLYQEKPGDPGNAYLFRFINAFRRSKGYFTRVLQDGFLHDGGEKFYFGGVYVAGTGRAGKVDQPFLEGVLRKIVREHDDLICWSEQALTEDRRSYRAATTLMAGGVLLTMGSVALLLAIVFRW